MITEKAFVHQTIRGILISLLFAFIITIIATQNIIITIITIFSVSMVIISVMGIMNLLGWDIGVTESISMVIMIGLSIDYILHLSIDYMHSPLQSRNDKIKSAYGNMGISIISGFLATLGSGLFLFLADIIIF